MSVNIFKHLLPHARAWSITANKKLRQFFEGLAAGIIDAPKLFIDQVWQDTQPQQTRELTLWENQFALPNTLTTEQERRDRLAATWKALGGQSPRYIQDTLQAAGFDVYVHEWWEPGSEPAVGVKAAATARVPFDNLTDGNSFIQYVSCDGAADMQDGDQLGVDISSEDSGPLGIFFKPDGTKMYMVGTTGDTVYQYSLSMPWVLTGMSYDSISFSVTTQDTGPSGIFFKPDGTKMYMMGAITGNIYQYSLPTPWVLTGMSYDSISFSVTTQESSPTSVSFKDDGTKMYVIGNTNDRVYQYSLPTAWVLTGATYDGVNFSVNTQDGTPRDIFFKPDGKKIYVVGSATGSIYQYSLPTAWVLTGATYDGVNFSVADQETLPSGLFFKDDGKKLYVVGFNTDTVYQYAMPNAWDMSLAWFESLAIDGATVQPIGYPLVNKTLIFAPGYVNDNSPDGQDGDALMMDGGFVTSPEYRLKRYIIPVDPTIYPYFLYIGGETFPAVANLSVSRKNEFETLCLKICPTQLWLGIIVSYS